MEEILAIVITIYCFSAIMWGVFAVEMQKFIHPNTSLVKVLFIFLVNTVLCPICIFLAALELSTRNGWAKKIKRTEDSNGD